MPTLARHLILAVISAYPWPGNCRAQSFCTPGARWTFTNYGMTYLCDVRGTITCDSASFVHGRMANALQVTAIGNMCYNGPLTTHAFQLLYAMDDGEVLTWTGTSWDTLYRFNAVPGDRWYAPGVEPDTNASCPTEQNHWVVTDTARTVVNGMTLDQFTLLQYRANDPLQPIFTTISERYEYPLVTPEITCEAGCGWYVPCSYYDDSIGEVDLAETNWRNHCELAWGDISTELSDRTATARNGIRLEAGALLVTDASGTAPTTLEPV